MTTHQGRSAAENEWFACRRCWRNNTRTAKREERGRNDVSPVAPVRISSMRVRFRNKLYAIRTRVHLLVARIDRRGTVQRVRRLTDRQRWIGSLRRVYRVASPWQNGAREATGNRRTGTRSAISAAERRASVRGDFGFWFFDRQPATVCRDLKTNGVFLYSSSDRLRDIYRPFWRNHLSNHTLNEWSTLV